jgi:hypothetical protein
MNSLTKSFWALVAANIAKQKWEFILPVINWGLWFCIDSIPRNRAFLFSHADSKDAPQTYAMITKYFVILIFILLSVIVFADLFKMLMIPNDLWVML